MKWDLSAAFISPYKWQNNLSSYFSYVSYVNVNKCSNDIDISDLHRTFSSTTDFFDLSHPSVWYVKCAFTVLFTFNSLVDLWRYVIPTLQGMRHPIALSPMEKDMLGVGDNGGNSMQFFSFSFFFRLLIFSWCYFSMLSLCTSLVLKCCIKSI